MTAPGIEMYYVYGYFPETITYNTKEFVEEVVQPFLMLCIMFLDVPMTWKDMLKLCVPNLALGTNGQSWYEDYELTMTSKPVVSSPVLYLGKTTGFHLVTGKTNTRSQQSIGRGKTIETRNTSRPMNHTVGTYLFLLGIYRMHAHPRTNGKDQLLFTGEQGGSLTEVGATALARTLLLREDDDALVSALQSHNGLLSLAKQCYLVRGVQATRHQNNALDIPSLYLAGNAANIGYITSDAVSVHYQAIKHLLEMERANTAWNVQYGNEAEHGGTIPGCPEIQPYELGPTLANLSLQAQKSDEYPRGVVRIDFNQTPTNYFRPYSTTKK
jgi:hypothetical protein